MFEVRLLPYPFLQLGRDLPIANVTLRKVVTSWCPLCPGRACTLEEQGRYQEMSLPGGQCLCRCALAKAP
jgi:hypothetical protein